jgi:type I restriction-modification system DNA methylase subunit
MTAPDSIKELVERFDLHRDAYRVGRYNETQLRNEFLNPFFGALGWDVLNKLGYSEENKHVIHEDSLEIEGMKKAPDYAFKVGKERKFFVEAKKPSVRIETNPEVAFQLKRYVWSAKLPLGILTDFEEFAVYECRSKPKVSDSVKTGRVMLLSYTDYIEKWDELVSIFSHDAVMTGGFDKFANSAAKKKGTAEVDSAFLAEIEGWRDALAKNVALRNKPQVKSEADLNYAVQMTIDRMIFLRICEDRGYESENQLQELSKRENVYDELKKLFEKADRRYNSGLFHFKDEKGRGRADTFTTGLEIDDKVLKDIIKDLYYPAPYVFALIPADILGQIYEQFLGKVIRLTAGGNAKVEEKPEVRKAGGVYYTPTFIVTTIVVNTLGKLLLGLTPKEAARLKILDPACGSGTFLLGAYQYLLDWYLNWYMTNDFEKWSKGRNAVLVQSKDSWKLTVEKKKEILLNNIYGVDIDPQAVEVTKLSLLLKVIEDPGQLSYLDERILPDLGKNIQCGNSLIGPDYWEGKMPGMISEEERALVNAFDWKARFPEVFAQGGFDVVVGNPPYVLGRETFDEGMKRYLSQGYDSFGGKYDLYIYFTEKAISLLMANGKFGFIIPNTLLANENAIKLRQLILDKTQLDLIRVFDKRVFANAQVESLIITASKKPATEHAIVVQIGEVVQEATQDVFARNKDYRFNVYSNSGAETIINKITPQSKLLGELSDICIGIQLGGSSGSDTKESFLSNSEMNDSYKKVLDGKNINYYRTEWKGQFVRYGNWLHRKRDEKYFLSPKIMIRQIGAVPVATFDDGQFYTLNTIYNLISTSEYSLKYFLAIINSKLGKWYWRSQNSDFKSLFPKIKKAQIESIPIKVFNFSDPAEKAQHDKMVSLVERMLALHKSLKSAHNPQEADRLAREVESTDKAIDQLVYELYGLTEEEIKIVKGE